MKLSTNASHSLERIVIVCFNCSFVRDSFTERSLSTLLEVVESVNVRLTNNYGAF